MFVECASFLDGLHIGVVLKRMVDTVQLDFTFCGACAPNVRSEQQHQRVFSPCDFWQEMWEDLAGGSPSCQWKPLSQRTTTIVAKRANKLNILESNPYVKGIL